MHGIILKNVWGDDIDLNIISVHFGVAIIVVNMQIHSFVDLKTIELNCSSMQDIHNLQLNKLL